MSTARKQPKKRLGKGLSAILDTQSAEKSHTTAIKQNTNKELKKPIGSDKNRILSDLMNDTNIDVMNSLADSPERSDHPAPGIRMIPLEQIRAGGHQPRTHFDEGALESLAASIRSVGVIQPITVRPASGGSYELIAGERRWRASKLAGLATIPVIVTDADEQAAAETALIENLQREDLNPIERSEAIRRLIDRFGLSQSAVADRVGLDRSSVSNLLRLADLEAPIRAQLAGGAISLGHGKALLSLQPGAERVRLADLAGREGWSVRRLEEEGRRRKNGGGAEQAHETGPASESGDVETRALERRLSEHLGTKVSLRVDKSGKGLVQIRFFDLDHFDDLMSRIGFETGGTG